MKTTLVLVTSALILAGCGGDGGDNKSSVASAEVSQNQASNKATGDSSKLKQFMNADNICDVISTTDIQQLFQTSATIDGSGFNHSNRYSCTYTWDKSDKDAREKLMMENMMQAAQGKAERLSMRLKMPTNQITITLSESKKSIANFMPPVLTEKQLADRIKMAKDAANKRLSDKQKEVAGDAANSMVERLMKQSNQNQKIDGVGDVAYWTAVGTGGLNVLLGEVEIYIGPMIADTANEDIENAKNIANILLQ